MRLKTDLSPVQKQIQAPIITPALQHALHVLQLPTAELEDLLQQEIAENPMLEEAQPGEASAAESAADDVLDPEVMPEAVKTREVNLEETGVGLSEIERTEWDEYFSGEDYEIPRYDLEFPREYREPQVSRTASLEEHLLGQLRLVCRSDEEFRIGESIIGNLDERGFLPLSLEEIAEEAKADKALTSYVLAQIQGLDPVGVAARDVQESLLIQLRQMPERHLLAETIIAKHLTAFERNQQDAIAKAEKVSREEVTAAIKVIAGLDPYPGRHFSVANVAYVVPDIVLEKHDDQYIILLNDEYLPQVRINRAYAMMLRKKNGLDEDSRNQLRDWMEKAKWLMRSIEERRKTLFRVAETIVELQMDFFEKGVEYMKPLTLREIAQRVNLHESTISRVTSRKYMQTPRGLFRLKYFFSSEIKTTDGVGISSSSVKNAIQNLIAEEDPKRPLSDQRLVELLKQQGMDIARRTVAKYREELNILATSLRKKR